MFKLFVGIKEYAIIGWGIVTALLASALGFMMWKQGKDKNKSLSDAVDTNRRMTIDETYIDNANIDNELSDLGMFNNRTKERSSVEESRRNTGEDNS